MEHRINVDLIRAMRAQLHNDPAHWVQGKWVTDLANVNRLDIILESGNDPFPACGTAYCAAGWTLALTGFHITPDNEWVPLAHIRQITGLDNATILSGLKIRQPRTVLIDPEIHVADAAEVILGLENVKIQNPRVDPSRVYDVLPAAHVLFAGGNTLEMIDQVISAIAKTVGIEV